MQVIRTLMVLFLAMSVPIATRAQSTTSTNEIVFPGESWELNQRPDTLGWDLEALAQASALAQEMGAAALMVIDRGHLVSESGRTAHRFQGHSVRKSLLSALYGIAVEEGSVRLDATLADLGVTDVGDLTAEESEARVIDLLRARSGVYHPAAAETRSMAASRPRRGSHDPGTHWYYNNWDFNALGSIYETETAQPIGEAFQTLVAGPVQMQDFRSSDVEYGSEEVSLHPAYRFRVSARDLARFGLLYLAQGVWRDRQVVPRLWTELSRTPYEVIETQRAPGGSIGYELLWWIATGVEDPRGLYYASGLGGQFVMVLPEEQVVIVTRVDTDAPCPEAGCLEVTRAEAATLAQVIAAAKLR